MSLESDTATHVPVLGPPASAAEAVPIEVVRPGEAVAALAPSVIRLGCPPPAARPAAEAPDPRARLAALARELTRSRNRRLVFEYLRLRRAAR